MSIYVTVVDSKRKKQTFPLREKPIIIGRSKKSHVVISDDLTSSQHMMIYIKDEAVYVEDLKSKNGIFLNGIKVLKQRLYIEDKVKMGDTMLYFEDKKMDVATIRQLTSENPTRSGANELTLELETYKEKTRRIDATQLEREGKSAKSKKDDFVKNSKLYAGVADNKEVLSGPTGKKLVLMEYIALVIDLSFSLLFSVLPFIGLQKALPETYEKMIKPDLGLKGLFEGEALYVSGASLLLCIIVFKIIRARKKGSLGEKILGLD